MLLVGHCCFVECLFLCSWIDVGIFPIFSITFVFLTGDITDDILAIKKIYSPVKYKILFKKIVISSHVDMTVVVLWASNIYQKKYSPVKYKIPLKKIVITVFYGLEGASYYKAYPRHLKKNLKKKLQKAQHIIMRT